MFIVADLLAHDPQQLVLEPGKLSAQGLQVGERDFADAGGFQCLGGQRIGAFGNGIEADQLSKIFTPFYSRFSSGIGLGMALVKRIIDDHNFEIKINSQKNIGTEVTVCFKNQQKY